VVKGSRAVGHGAGNIAGATPTTLRASRAAYRRRSAARVRAMDCWQRDEAIDGWAEAKRQLFRGDLVADGVFIHGGGGGGGSGGVHCIVGVASATTMTTKAGRA
jgi:hypothetical protein